MQLAVRLSEVRGRVFVERGKGEVLGVEGMRVAIGTGWYTIG